MKAAFYEKFKGQVTIKQLPDPAPSKHGVVIQVMATGLCRSDWHGWMGHDPDITLPHVPGHEFAGVVKATGKEVRQWKTGDRVTVPFVCGCGTCHQCLSGNQQICDNQFQPGFTAWGSFAEYVAIDYADTNLVRLPENIDYVTGSILGCPFVTSFRAVEARGKVSAGYWVAVYGCGGVGLSAIMIAGALGANVIAVDITNNKLKLARSIGAIDTINANEINNVAEKVIDITNGGAHVSIDALGSHQTCIQSISCLRKQGKHIQIGLMFAEESNPPIPMDKVIANELEILGSHGIQAYEYDRLLKMIEKGKLHPEKLIDKTINLEESTAELVDMKSFSGTGITVINKF